MQQHPPLPAALPAPSDRPRPGRHARSSTLQGQARINAAPQGPPARRHPPFRPSRARDGEPPAARRAPAVPPAGPVRGPPTSLSPQRSPNPARARAPIERRAAPTSPHGACRAAGDAGAPGPVRPGRRSAAVRGGGRAARCAERAAGEAGAGRSGCPGRRWRGGGARPGLRVRRLQKLQTRTPPAGWGLKHSVVANDLRFVTRSVIVPSRWPEFDGDRYGVCNCLQCWRHCIDEVLLTTCFLLGSRGFVVVYATQSASRCMRLSLLLVCQGMSWPHLHQPCVAGTLYLSLRAKSLAGGAILGGHPQLKSLDGAWQVVVGALWTLQPTGLFVDISGALDSRQNNGGGRRQRNTSRAVVCPRGYHVPVANSRPGPG